MGKTAGDAKKEISHTRQMMQVTQSELDNAEGEYAITRRLALSFYEGKINGITWMGEAPIEITAKEKKDDDE